LVDSTEPKKAGKWAETWAVGLVGYWGQNSAALMVEMSVVGKVDSMVVM